MEIIQSLNLYTSFAKQQVSRRPVEVGSLTFGRYFIVSDSQLGQSVSHLSVYLVLFWVIFLIFASICMKTALVRYSYSCNTGITFNFVTNYLQRINV